MRKLFLIFLLLIGYLIPSQIPLSGLIGAWPFSGNPNDVSGSNNHGSVFGGATLVADRCGNSNSAYLFNGSTSYIQMLTTGPVGNASRSISFWAKTTHTQVSSPRSAFDYGTALGAGDSYQIVWSYCALGVGLDVSNQALIRGNACLYNNTWHHIVAVYNSSISTIYSTVVYYIDGVAQPAINCNVSGTGATINTGTVFPITVGRGATSATRYFNGTIDDVYLYNRPLSAAEVLQLYTALPVCPPPVFGNSLVCPGSQNIYSVQPISNASYTWSLPGGWTGSSSTNTIFVTAGSAPGTLSVSASSSCGIFPTSTLALTPYFLSPLNIVSSNPVVCSGVSVSLSVSGSGTYTWLPSGSTGSSIVVSPLSTNVYTVVSTNTNNFCSQSSIFTQSVVINPTITANSAGSVACNGNSIVLSGTGANSYTWLPANLNGSSVSVAPLTNSTFTLLGMTPFGCTASVTHSVSVPPLLNLSITATSFTACPGNNILLNTILSGGTPAFTFTWSNGGNASSSPYQSFLPANLVASVSVMDANACMATNSVLINFVTVGSLTATSATICPNSVASLSVTGSGTYTWHPSGFVGDTYTISTAIPQQFTIQATSSVGCLSSASSSVFIKPTPSLTFNTFSITCGSLGSATVSASGGTGPFQYTWTPTAQTNSVATGLFPGTYTLTFLDVGTGCVFTPTTTFFPLVPLTGTVSSTNSLLCNSVNTGTASIALSNGSGTQTYTWTNAIGTLNTPTASGLAAGISTVQVIDALTFCSVTQTFLITQPPAFSLNIVASTPSVCLGGSINLSASNSGGTPPYTYTWVSGPASTSVSVSESTAGIFSYTVNSLDANQCFSSKTQPLSFVPNPTLSVSDISICPLETGSLVVTGASSYTWSNGSIGPVFAASPSVNTQYTVVGSALSCSSSATASIILKPVPVALAYNNGPVCTGQTLLLFSSGGSANWTGPLSFTSALSSPSVNASAQNASGIYQVIVTAANNCTASTLTSASVHPVPFLSVLGSTVCEGQILPLYAYAQSGTSYSWTGPNSFTSNLQNPQISPSSTLSGGLYSLVISSAQSCTNSTLVQVSVTPLPIVSIVGKDSVCSGENLVLSASGAANYFWAGPHSFFSNNSTITMVNVVPQISGIYSLTSSTGVCQIFTTIPVQIHPLPLVNATNNSPVCEFSTLELFSLPATSYTWSGPFGFSSNLQNPMLNNVHSGMSGNYTLELSNQFGCDNSGICNVQILTGPNLSVFGDTVCIGNDAQLSALGGVTYTWTGPAGFSSSMAAVSIPSITLLNCGAYTVVSAASNGCTVQALVNLTGLDLPLPVPIIHGNPNVCLHSPLILSASGSLHYIWTTPGQYSTSAIQYSMALAEYSATGIYTLNAWDSNRCMGSSTIQVNVLALPQTEFHASQNNACVPFCSKITLGAYIGGAGLASVSAYYNGQSYSEIPFELCLYSSGHHSIGLVITDSNQCMNNNTLLIEAYPNVSADFYFEPQFPLAGTDLVNFLNASQGIGQNAWNWFFIANTNDTLFGQNCSFLFEQSGKYPVVFLVQNQWGCSDTVIKVVTVEEEFTIYFPNTFTPNGDGLNDVFQPAGMGFNSFQMNLFDRWGQLIFTTNDFLDPWNGTFKGEPCPIGIYTWTAEIKTWQGVLVRKIGQVNLIR